MRYFQMQGHADDQKKTFYAIIGLTDEAYYIEVSRN